MHHNLLKLANIYYKYSFETLKNVINRKADIPIIVDTNSSFGMVTATAITETESHYIPSGFVVIDHANLPLNPDFNIQDWYKISAIQADNGWITIYLLGFALYYAGKLITDDSITPLMQAIMRRMYKKYFGSSFIIPEVVENIKGLEDKPWLRAGYLNPGTGDEQYRIAIEAGEELKRIISDQSLENFLRQKWNSIYFDPKRTGEDKEEKLEILPEIPTKSLSENILDKTR